MENHEPTISEVLEAVNDAATKTGARLTAIEANMVTKNYLDDKLADLRGDLVVLLRQEDTKVKTFIEVVKKNKGITEEDAIRLYSMTPFPDPRATLL